MPRSASLDPPLPRVVTRTEALAAGMTRDHIRQRVRSGRWRPLAHGVYDRGAVDMSTDRFDRERQEHAHRAEAAALACGGSAAALHSAAVLVGLPLWRPLPSPVSLNVALGSWNGTRPGVVIHRMTMDEGDVVNGRVPTTSVARTCVDLARLSSLSDGLTASDAALRAGSVTSSALVEVAERTRDRRGRRRGLVAAREASALRESPAESASWAYFLHLRIPLPQCQVVMVDRWGTFLARVDFWWESARLVGECDGRMKYASVDDLYAEKRREDALRSEGLQVVRWSPEDLRTTDLARRLRRFLT